MLDKIVNMVKERVMDSVDGINDIPENKKQETVETTTHSLVDGLKNYVSAGNISSLVSMLGGRKGSETGKSDMTSGLESTVISALTSKVGLNQGVAQKIATTVIPAVMSLFRKKVDDDNEPGFNIQSLIGSLGGNSSGEKGGLMDMVGSLFNK